ncbi:MAG: sugar nucleotide-binding protein [Planctomycetes bacterium]|nr:sugar nucleotide-binding protein [Planctomycetota bacterium]
MNDGAPVSTFVLGGSGFLGAHVAAAAWNVERRRTDGRRGNVIAASRVPARTPNFWQPRESVGLVALDALAEHELERTLDELAPSRVICCAALSRIAECESDPSRAEAVNVEVPRRLARWAAARGARCVHVSTDLVFGKRMPPPHGFAESAATDPISVYGATKARGERAVLEENPNALVVRLPLLFGDSGGRGLGASDSLLAALRSPERPMLFRDEWRTPLDVANAADALIELAQTDQRGVLHVAGPARLSRVELGHLTLRAAGKKSAELYELVRAGTRGEAGLSGLRPCDVSLDATRALQFLKTTLLAPREALARRAAGHFRTIP